ncbi:MAG: hypothetical protein LJE95_16290 [Acidobacteria bacterium]|nr:hypothetical protein [Acidobacteriota bacterium]
MAALSAWSVPLLAVLVGWLATRVLQPGSGLDVGLWEPLVWACVAVAGGLVAFDLAGIRWTATGLVVLLVAIAGLLGAVAWRGALRSGESQGLSRRAGNGAGSWMWPAVAVAAAGLHALILALTPSFGWDFRYIWGLKARVFAAAGAHDLGWLAWHGFAFARTDYPPLWPDLIAGGVLVGAGAGAVAAAWTALFALGLAAVAWTATARAPAPVRALAAVCAAWAPVVFAQNVHVSGSAEATAAFFTAVVVAGVVKAIRDRDSDGWAVVVAAAAALALTKNEGAVLAVAIGVAAAPRLRLRRAAWLVGTPVVVFGCWRALVWSRHIPGLALRLDPAWIGARVLELPSALASAVDPAAGLCLALLVASLALLRGAAGRTLRVAFALWGAAALLTYLVAAYDLAWYVQTSLARVVSTPVPILLALALDDAWQPRREQVTDLP